MKETEAKGQLSQSCAFTIDTDIETPLQRKLAQLATTIGKFAYLAAFLIFVVLIVYDIILIFSDSSRVLISHNTLHALLNNCMVCVAILIVCVPEGMPLAVSIATAFSTDRMQEESLLIKDMTALESSG